uniref:FAD-binding domain-containing protein n=1 Tax=Prymnesium polylepis TaxID=72548 RepID=A0A7S4MF36_9EUKA
MPFTTTSTMWQLSFPYAEEAARQLVKDPSALKAEIMRLCGRWHEPVPALLSGTPLDGMSGYPVYDRDLLKPDVLQAAARSVQTGLRRRVTLIGDAAHPMTPFKAQGANQALSDAVLLADCLVHGVDQHGPHHGFDVALPIFESKMLSRSARMVVGSREKAKEMHSSLALQPSRKVQREVDVDMQKVIQFLHTKGIGAQNASDPRGLDAVVAEAMGSCANKILDDGTKKERKKRRNGLTSADEDQRRQIKKGVVGDEPEECEVFGIRGIFEDFVGSLKT